MKKILLPLAILVLLGCKDPMSTFVSTSESDKQKMQETMQRLSEEDKQLVVGYIMRTALTNLPKAEQVNFPTGVTFGEAIKNQKEWLAAEKTRQEKEAADKAKREQEEAALKAKLDAEIEQARKQIEETVRVAVLSLTVQPENASAGRYSDYQKVILGLENKSKKNIEGVKGAIAFYDIFEKEVGKIAFSYDDGLKPGKSEVWIGERKINRFIDEHAAIARLEAGKYTTKFIPEMIVFSDGTKLAAR